MSKNKGFFSRFLERKEQKPPPLPPRPQKKQQAEIEQLAPIAEFKESIQASSAELQSEESIQAYNFILLVGENLSGIEELRDYLREKEEKSGGKFKGVIFGDGKKTIKDLIEEKEVQNAFDISDEKTLLGLNAHGDNYEPRNIKRAFHRSDKFSDTPLMFDEVIQKAPKIKNIKYLSCFGGTNSRAIIAGTMYGNYYKLVTEDVTVYELGDSKYSSRRYDSLVHLKETIDILCEGAIQGKTSLINKEEMIISALRDPASLYIKNKDGSAHKLSRLFRDKPKDQNGDYIVGSDFDQEMELFIKQKVTELKKIFPDSADPQNSKLIDELVRSELENGLVETLKSRVLHMYISRGTLSVVKALMKIVDVNVKDKNGYTPLMLAGLYNELEIVELILANENTDPNIQNKFGKTTFMYAYLDNKIAVMHAFLASNKTSPDILLESGESLLMLAGKDGKLDVVKLLLEFGANPNIQDSFGNTLLSWACENEKLDIIELLLSNEKTDPNIKANKLEPLSIACVRGKLPVTKLLLANKRTDTNVKSGSGDTLLISMCEYEELDMVKLLLNDNRTDPNIKGRLGKTPLMLACRDGKLDIIELLLTNEKTDPYIKDNDGKTVLDLTLDEKKYDIALLICLKNRDYDKIKEIVTQINKIRFPGHDLKINTEIKNDIKPLKAALKSSPKDFAKLCDELRTKRGYDKIMELEFKTPSTSPEVFETKADQLVPQNLAKVYTVN